jgi:ATP-dependent DNA helicase DinG
VSTAQVLELARDTRSEAVAAARDCLDLPTSQQEAGEGGQGLAPGGRPRRRALLLRSAAEEKPDFLPALKAWRKKSPVRRHLETQAERAEGLEKCWQRAVELVQRLGQLAEA